MKKNKSNIKHFPLIIEQDEDDMYIISCPTFKGCHAQGKNLEHAIQNIKEVIGMCVEELEEKNITNHNRFIGFREIEFPFPQKVKSIA